LQKKPTRSPIHEIERHNFLGCICWNQTTPRRVT
jgi:hypothetical protein